MRLDTIDTSYDLIVNIFTLIHFTKEYSERKVGEKALFKSSIISETLDNLDHLNHHLHKIPANLNFFIGGEISLGKEFK